MIHYVGDVHQPLHTVSRVNSEYPKGDRGGNSEWIDPHEDGVGNLHQIWDSIIYTYTGYESLPMKDSDWEYYSGEVNTLNAAYPIDASTIYPGDFNTWAAEGLQLAETMVYPGFNEHTAQTDEYKETTKPILEERVMLGGARLAALISDIYGPSIVEILN